MATENEHEIMSRCKGGDTSAFRLLMETHQGYAFALAFRMLCDEEEAKDAVQEAFIRVWKNINRYDPAVKFTTWLYTIVTNLCLDALRARTRHPAAMNADVKEAALAQAMGNEDPERTFTNKELASTIEALTATLPPTQRKVFVLRDLQELAIREVSEILGLSESSVKTNLVYARRSIRLRLEANECEGGRK